MVDTGLGEGLGVVAVARKWCADGDDELGVGVDDHLIIRGITVILRLAATVWSRVDTSVPSTISTVR